MILTSPCLVFYFISCVFVPIYQSVHTSNFQKLLTRPLLGVETFRNFAFQRYVHHWPLKSISGCGGCSFE